MTPIFAVIITFGVVFATVASLAQGVSSTMASLKAGFADHTQATVMLLLAKLIAIPVLLIGLAALLHFEAQVNMAICVVALTAGASFIPWVTGLGKGNIAYSASASMLLTVLTFILLPFTLPVALNILGTGAKVSVWLIASPIIFFMAIPLVLGLVLRARYPKLVMEIGPYLGPIAITALLLHVTLFIAATWSDITSLFLTGVFVFSVAIPLISMLVGYLAIPPYVLSPVPAANPHRGTKLAAIVSTTLSNTGATIMCAIFVLGQYQVAGVGILIFVLVAIFAMAIVSAEAGKRFEKA